MPETEKTLNIIGADRKAFKDNLIKEFLKEEPGTSEETSTYYYYVEKTTDGVDIFLKRPARLNKGMDFEVHADNVLFENESESGRVTRTSRPSHSTILNDLDEKKIESASEYAKVITLIDKIYNCENVMDEEMRALSFKTGHPIELILKIVKWLFIEQDITYWNWSGRKMFYSGIPK
jgi:hypothetical protein